MKALRAYKYPQGFIVNFDNGDLIQRKDTPWDYPIVLSIYFAPLRKESKAIVNFTNIPP